MTRSHTHTHTLTCTKKSAGAIGTAGGRHAVVHTHKHLHVQTNLQALSGRQASDTEPMPALKTLAKPAISAEDIEMARMKG